MTFEEFYKERLFDAYVKQFGIQDLDLTDEFKKLLYKSFKKDLKKYGTNKVVRHIVSYASFYNREIPEIMAEKVKAEWETKW